MKAIVLTKYGTPEDLELREVQKPVPKDDEVLIKVNASAVNDWDWGLLQGKPLFMRAFWRSSSTENPDMNRTGIVGGRVT